MNLRTHCDDLWRKRLGALTAVWPEFLRGDIQALHKTRVASRRIREALPVVAAGAAHSKVRKLKKKLRELTRVLGPIRELDVDLGLIEAGDVSGAPHRHVMALVRREVASRRRALRDDLSTQGDVLDVDRLMKKLERISERDNRGKKGAAWRRVLGVRLLRRAKRLKSAVEQAGSLYVPERIHDVRIATKKLRYGLEVAQEAGFAPAGPLVNVLKRQQERLGRLHDLQSLLHRVRDLWGSSQGGARLADLTAYADSIEQECRRLHAEFVVDRDVLLRIAKDVRQRLVPAVTVPRLEPARVTTRPGQRKTSARTARTEGRLRAS